MQVVFLMMNPCQPASCDGVLMGVCHVCEVGWARDVFCLVAITDDDHRRIHAHRQPCPVQPPSPPPVMDLIPKQPPFKDLMLPVYGQCVFISAIKTLCLVIADHNFRTFKVPDTNSTIVGP